MAVNGTERIFNFDREVEAARRWRERTERRLLEYDVGPNFAFLCKNGANREELLRRVSALVCYSPRIEPRRLDPRKAQGLAKKIESTAELIENLTGSRWLGAAYVSGGHWRETEVLPSQLREYAARLRRLPSEVAKRWEPVKTAAICQLIWYVKHSTGAYRDEHVSALISATLKDDRHRRIPHATG